MNQESPALSIFKALADDCRLRILRAVSIAELSVAELVRVLGLPQSTVSRQLKPLRECGLLDSRRDGTSVYYHRGPAFADAELSSLLDRHLAELPLDAEDRTSVRRALDQRRAHNRDFFDEMAGRYGSLTEPGGGWPALAAGLALGYVGQVVADLGAGEGALSLLLARGCKKVIAVDLSPKMLVRLREAADRSGVGDRIQTLEADLETLPISDASVDTVFLSQALHHAADPGRALSEASRILKPGGRLVLLDLCAHEQDWVREQYADVWLGFDPDTLTPLLKAAGLTPQFYERLPGATMELPVLFSTAIKTQSEG
ncbi:MAG: metalloregulator ArsR/SmtB family transcription factor [Verrucomicrobia bacterium]|nr:metalloregulator ArsR/SmtB family transcription factor [Verrucomicrobiota bacterium]MCH8526783.1 metalloregulator ArsR/SmtB family transcription factor [Kiritimatiellia bacterium]